MASVVECLFTGCGFKVTNDSEKIALAMFESHMLTHSKPVPSLKLPPMPRPEINQDITEEDWVCTNTEWTNYKSYLKSICPTISDKESKPIASVL